MSDLHQSIRHALVAPRDKAPPRLPGIPARFSPPLAVVGGVILLIAIGVLDYVTPADYHFGLYYGAPVLLAAWFSNRASGYFMAVAGAGTELVADLLGAQPYTDLRVAYFNSITNLIWFIAAVYLLSEVKASRSRLEAIVVERTKSLRSLASELSEAEDSERRRLAHDIHDGFSQILSVLKLNMAQTLTLSTDPSRDRLRDAVTMVDELIQRSRTLTFDLHPAMLEHLGLAPTLRQHAAEFSRQAGVEVLVNEDGAAGPLPIVIANYLFRSAKELMNNAAKHGHARQIVVGVHWFSAFLRIVIDDDGQGFDPKAVFAPNVSKGLGLAGIHERLLSLGGSLRLESSIGKGSRVVMEVPLTQAEVTAS